VAEAEAILTKTDAPTTVLPVEQYPSWVWIPFIRYVPFEMLSFCLHAPFGTQGHKTMSGTKF